MTHTIYVFLNQTVADIEHWVAVAEDGFALAAHSVPVGQSFLAKKRLGKDSKWKQNYDQHFPGGSWQIQIIENINAPENVFILNRIRQATQKRHEEREEQKALAKEIIASIEIKDLTEIEKAQLAAARGLN